MNSRQQTAVSSKGRLQARRTGFCLLLTACCLLLPLASGCIYRSLTIRTDPPGAMVYVNDQLKGESPVTYDFTWYGWYRVMIRREGFQRLDDRKNLRAPVYLWIPFDLVMELLPFRVKDRRTWSYTLTPQQEPAAPIPPALFKKAPDVKAEVAPGAPPSTTESQDEPR